MSQATQVMEDKIHHLQRQLTLVEQAMAADLLHASQGLSSLSLPSRVEPLVQTIQQDCFLLADNRYAPAARLTELKKLARHVPKLIKALSTKPGGIQKKTCQSLQEFVRRDEKANLIQEKLLKARRHLDNVLNASAQEGPGFEAPFEAPFLESKTQEQLHEAEQDEKKTLKLLRLYLSLFQNKYPDPSEDTSLHLKQDQREQLHGVYSDMLAFRKLFDGHQQDPEEQRRLAYLLSERLQAFIYQKPISELTQDPYQDIIPALYTIKLNVDHYIQCHDRIANIKSRFDFLESIPQVAYVSQTKR